MKNIQKLLFITILIFASFSIVKSETGSPNNDLTVTKRIYTINDIKKIAGGFLENKFNIKNPAIADVDKDGLFDILNFTNEGRIEFYKNTGTNEKPDFILINDKYDNVEINSIFNGIPVPVFFADMDGDKDLDMFAVTDIKFNKDNHQKIYEIKSLENTMDLDMYTLITVILILVIVVLVLAIAGK